MKKDPKGRSYQQTNADETLFSHVGRRKLSHQYNLKGL